MMTPQLSQDETLSIARKHHWLAREAKNAKHFSTGPLVGMSFFAKDLFALEGEVNRAGSKVFDDEDAESSDATMVRQAKQGGANLLGTTNMDPLAYGFVSNNPEYGLAQNPHDFDRICGGSSGGSAAVVAAGLCDFALGTDTSGSVRIPSAFCGVAGYKPSAGLFDNSGIAALSPTFDRPGLFAKNTKTVRKVVHELMTTPEMENSSKTVGRIGLLGGYFMRGIDLVVHEAVMKFAAEIGARTDLHVPGAEAARAACYILVAYEAAQIHRERLGATPERFDAETRHRLLAATLIEDSWRNRSIHTQQDFSHKFEHLFEEFDFVVAPCVPMVAPHRSQLKQAEQKGPPLRASLGKYTQPISLTGCPVVSIPLATSAGLPTAVQLIGPIGSDVRLLEFAAELS